MDNPSRIIGLNGEKSIINKIIYPLLSRSVEGGTLGPLDDARDFIPKAPRIVVNSDGGDVEAAKYKWRTYADVGWSMIVGALGDHIVKGSIPYAILVTMGIPASIDVSVLENLFNGIYAAVREYRLKYLGGDLNSSCSIWVSVTAIGFTSAKKLPRRDGALPGDKIVVVGEYGASGLIALEGEEYANMYPWIKEVTQRPHIRIELAHIVAKHYRSIHASMDVSDGLGYTIYEISMRSGVRSILKNKPLYYEAIDDYCSRRRNREECLWSTILSGGEEYGGVFYVDPAGLEEFINDLESFNIPYRVVGEAAKDNPGIEIEGIEHIDIMYWDQLQGWKKL